MTITVTRTPEGTLTLTHGDDVIPITDTEAVQLAAHLRAHTVSPNPRGDRISAAPR